MEIVRKDVKKRYTLGPVYVPDQKDSQDEWASASTIEAACWRYMGELQKGVAGLNDSHQDTPFDADLGSVVECYCAPADMTVEGRVIKQGSWLLGVVWSPEAFKKIEAGERVGFSMQGKGTRV